MKPLTRPQANALAQAIQINDYSLRHNYSGRGMRGKECFGFTVDELTSPIQAVMMVIIALMEAQMSDEDANEPFNYIHDIVTTLAAGRPKLDSLGRDTIIYFQDIQFPENWGDEEEDEEEEDEDEEVSEETAAILGEDDYETLGDDPSE